MVFVFVLFLFVCLFVCFSFGSPLGMIRYRFRVPIVVAEVLVVVDVVVATLVQRPRVTLSIGTSFVDDSNLKKKEQK